MAVQGLGHALAHLAGPHHQHPGAGQSTRPAVGGQGHRAVGERGDAPGDGRLRPDPLAGLDGMAEEGAEHRARDLLALGPLPGPSDLAEDLGLAEHRRVEPGGHREEMAGDVVVEPDGEVLGQRLDRAAADGGQELLDLGHAVVEALDHRVDLGAQAGRQDDRLGQVGLVPQAPERLGEGALGDRHPVEQVEGDWRCSRPTTITDTGPPHLGWCRTSVSLVTCLGVNGGAGTDVHPPSVGGSTGIPTSAVAGRDRASLAGRAVRRDRTSCARRDGPSLRWAW